MALVWYMRDSKAHITVDGGSKRHTHVLPYGFCYVGTFGKIKPIDLPARRPVTVTVGGSPEEVEKAMVFLRVWLDFDPPQEEPVSVEVNVERFLARPPRPGFTGRYKAED